MSYVPGFRYDLFVSYASEDNVDGWVEEFQKQLTAEVTRLVGRPFSERTVFFDKLRLKVGQAYPAELDNAARESALLIALLSPNYVTSDWCTRERQQFQENLPRNLSFPQCLAAVLVRPTKYLPQILQTAQHMSFVAESEQPWPSSSKRFLDAINKLAVQIRDVLQKLRSCAGAVFLGATLPTDMDLRPRLGDYLSKQRFRAIPDPGFLDDRTAVQKALAEAACALHLVGGASELALQAIEDSLQNCHGPTVVFQPFGARLTAAEELVLSALPLDCELHRPGPNEIELQKFLEELLSNSEKKAAGAVSSLSLVCEPVDFPWAKLFHAEDISVDYPKFLLEKLTQTDKIRRWRQMVRESHGLLFYQGQSHESVLDLILRLADEERSKAERCWYISEPDLEQKKQRRPTALPYPMGLSKFLEKVRRRSSAGGL